MAIPTLVMGLHRVHLDQHPTRAAVTPLDPHNRVEIRISYRSKLAQVRGGPVWLEAEYRRTSEVDPPSAVEAAGLHRSERFHVSVHGANGVVVSWTTGSHPTDFDDAGHWSIGFRARM